MDSDIELEAESASLSINAASRCLIKAIKNLKDRDMVFSLCLNERQVLIMCGLNMLYKVLGSRSGSDLVPGDSQLLEFVSESLKRGERSGYEVFKQIASLGLSLQNSQQD